MVGSYLREALCYLLKMPRNRSLVQMSHGKAWLESDCQQGPSQQDVRVEDPNSEIVQALYSRAGEYPLLLVDKGTLSIQS
jgi:hypothetical protein